MLFFYSEVIDRWAVLVDLGEAANPLILEENWCLYFLGFCRRISGPARIRTGSSHFTSLRS